MLVKIEARILTFPGTDFHFPSTSVPPGTFLGSDFLCTFSTLLMSLVGSRKRLLDGGPDPPGEWAILGVVAPLTTLKCIGLREH